MCDSSDWVKVDTRTVITADGPKAYHFLVIGDPCNHPEKIPDEVGPACSAAAERGCPLHMLDHVCRIGFWVCVRAASGSSPPGERLSG